MTANGSATAPKRRTPGRVLDGTILVLIAGVSLACLEPEQLAYILSPWSGFLDILPTTAWAAVKVWAFWAAAATLLSAMLWRIEPVLGRLDAVIGGLMAPWILAYIGANVLGPIGFFRAWTIWVLLAALAAWLWPTRQSLSRATEGPWPPGAKLALLALALQAPVLLVLQLGSPVPPFMDIFATPASAQRIVTFGLYLPFDNDPYGYWDAASQLPGLETFYALLALGSGTSLAVLAETASIVPITGLLMLGTYRLGRALAGDLAGGFAALGLFATMLLHVLPYMHGRSVAFVPAAVGLAFCLDSDRNCTRIALGALALATAVASHAIIGAFAMVVVAGEVLFWLLGGQFVAAAAGTAMLAGTTLVAFPTIAVGLRLALPYPVLPLVQLLGVLIIALSARALHRRPMQDRARWLGWLLAMWVAYVLLWHPSDWMTNNHHGRFPLLVYGGGLGLVIALGHELAGWRPRRATAGQTQVMSISYRPVTIALLLGMVIEYGDLQSNWKAYVPDPKVQVAIADLVWKVDYWYPWVLVFPTAMAAVLVSRIVPLRVVSYVVLALLFLPWCERYWMPQDPGYADPNDHQHAIAESWAYQLETGKQGYWGNTRHRRWAQGEAEFQLFEVLREEIAAGRITTDTHIVHLGPYTYLYKDNLLFSVFTGINGDLYITGHKPDWSIAGGRIRPIEEVAARIAERPPYVAIHVRADPDPGNVDPTPFATGLDDYVEIFNRDGVRLLRYDAPRGRI